MKEYSILTCVSELKPHHQMQGNAILWTCLILRFSLSIYLVIWTMLVLVIIFNLQILQSEKKLWECVNVNEKLTQVFILILWRTNCIVVVIVIWIDFYMRQQEAVMLYHWIDLLYWKDLQTYVCMCAIAYETSIYIIYFL